MSIICIYIRQGAIQQQPLEERGAESTRVRANRGLDGKTLKTFVGREQSTLGCQMRKVKNKLNIM